MTEIMGERGAPAVRRLPRAQTDSVIMVTERNERC